MSTHDKQETPDPKRKQLESALAMLRPDMDADVSPRDRAQWHAVNIVDDALFWAQRLTEANDIAQTPEALVQLAGLVLREQRLELEPEENDEQED